MWLMCICIAVLRFIIQVHWDLCVIKRHNKNTKISLFFSIFECVGSYSHRKRNSNQPIILAIIIARERMGLHVIDVRKDVNGPPFQSNKYAMHCCPWIFKGGYARVLSIDGEPRSPIARNGNSMHAVIFVNT